MSAAACNVYMSPTPCNVYMRIGGRELQILSLLYQRNLWWSEIKDQLSGKAHLNFHKQGFDSWNNVNIKHKSLVRSMRTLQEKGLISNHGEKKLTIIEITELGKQEYFKRIHFNGGQKDGD